MTEMNALAPLLTIAGAASARHEDSATALLSDLVFSGYSSRRGAAIPEYRSANRAIGATG
jgi:hypothetical protein